MEVITELIQKIKFAKYSNIAEISDALSTMQVQDQNTNILIRDK